MDVVVGDPLEGFDVLNLVSSMQEGNVFLRCLESMNKSLSKHWIGCYWEIMNITDPHQSPDIILMGMWSQGVNKEDDSSYQIIGDHCSNLLITPQGAT